MPLDNTDWAADQYLPKIPTEALVAELRKRGFDETTTLEVISMLEDEKVEKKLDAIRRKFEP